jgi:hypothetical protein
MLAQTLKRRGKIYTPTIRVIDGVSFNDYRPLEPKVLAEIDQNSFIHFTAELNPELTKAVDGHSVSFHNQSAGVLISIGGFSPEAYSVKFSSLANPINETRTFTGNNVWELKHATIHFLAANLPINA